MKKKLLVIAGLCLAFSTQAHADRVRMLVSNKSALGVRFDLIKSAKEEILVEYFEVHNDEIGKRGLALLQEAARRGVKVKFLVDNMHNTMTNPDMAVATNALKDVTETDNFKIKVFNPISNPNLPEQTYRNHDKLMVVDGKYMIMGGRNVGDGYFGMSKETNFRDMDVMVKGDSVKSARQYFMDLWEKNPMVKDKKYWDHNPKALDPVNCAASDHNLNCLQKIEFAGAQVKASRAEMMRILKEVEANHWKVIEPETLFEDAYDADVKFMANDPTKKMKDVQLKLVEQLGKVIGENSRQSLTIVTPYLFPTKDSMELLRKLTANNIKVRIVTNSLASTDTPLVHLAMLSIKKELAAMKVDLYEYTGKEVLHTKAAIIDAGSPDAIGLMGSFNFDRRSALINREIALSIKDLSGGKFMKTMNGAIERVIDDSIISIENGKIVNVEKLDEILVKNLGAEKAQEKREKMQKQEAILKLFPNQI